MVTGQGAPHNCGEYSPCNQQVEDKVIVGRNGQVVFRRSLREERLEIVDGFKRWTAASACGWTTLSVKVASLDERLAKAARAMGWKVVAPS